MMLFPEEGSGGDPIRVPYAPQQIEYQDFGGEYVTITRPGLVDALVYSRPKMRKLSFSLVLVDRELRSAGGSSTTVRMHDTISLFTRYATAGIKMRMAYSSLEAGSWRITSFGMSSILRSDFGNEVTHATCEVELTQASDIVTGLGPVTGGHGEDTPRQQGIPQPAVPGSITAQTGAHPVVAGDTLWSIAVRYYGNGNRWTDIAAANGITDPRLLFPGTILRIP